MLRKCPPHGSEDSQQIQILYNGLIQLMRAMVDRSTRGSLYTKTLEEGYQLIETMASNDYQLPSNRVVVKKGVMGLDTLSAILAQNASIAPQMTNLTKQLNEMKVNVVNFTQPAAVCELCGGNHLSNLCEANSFVSQKQINCLGNPPRAQNNPYSNTYNLSQRNNPNFSWNQRPPHNQNSCQPDRISKLESTLEKFMQETTENLKNQRAMKHKQVTCQDKMLKGLQELYHLTQL